MRSEIGSEFEQPKEDQSGNGIKFPVQDYILTLSGRTAIELALEGIKTARKALLPSYCCDSMIEPFRKANIQVEYYDVSFDGELSIHIDISDDIDILLWCNYFGFRQNMPDMSFFKDRGGIIIEDITHSFLSDTVFNQQSDYLVGSVRKWDAVVCGGFYAPLRKRDRVFRLDTPPEQYIEKRTTAMRLKAEYIAEEDESKKPVFLKMYSECNKWLSEYYSHMGIDDYSRRYLNKVNIGEYQAIRRENGEFLLHALEHMKGIYPLFPLEQMDCPLFIPLVVPANRNRIRDILTENGIYCPIHWPHPNASCKSNLYELELSLVCDHRYGIKDMQRMVSVLERIS